MHFMLRNLQMRTNSPCLTDACVSRRTIYIVNVHRLVTRGTATPRYRLKAITELRTFACNVRASASGIVRSS
jgi:hypothetical protein